MKIKDITQGIAASCMLLLGVLFVSCDDMDSIQREYADREEQTYLGKVDSIRFSPGLGRVKITWYIPADPKIDRTIIYWNLRKDSLVKEFVREVPGVQKDSVIISNLREGSMLFEFKNVSKEGHTSLISSGSGTIWGQNYADGLRSRNLTGLEYDYQRKQFKLDLSTTTPGDGVVYTEFSYPDSTGAEKLVKVDRTSNQVVLENFPDGTEFRYRTVFYPPNGIDTLANSYSVRSSPTAVHDPGTAANLVSGDTLKFFERNGDQLFEWNAKGDIKIYGFDGNGKFTLQNTYPGLVPRTTYRDLFFYDDDKFIGIGTNNNVYLLRISNGQMSIVRTPAGVDYFGTGFSFPQFIPAVGYFFSISAVGEIKTWLAKNDATWGTPNGTTVGTNYNAYRMLTLFNNQSLLGVDAEGYLWATSVTVDGVLGSRSRIGSGWGRFRNLYNFGNHLIAVDNKGKVVVFENFTATDKYWIVDEQ